MKVLSTEILSPDNVREICLGENNQKFERLTQKVDAKTGVLASKSRSLNPEIVEKVLVRPIPIEQLKVDISNPVTQMSEEERQKIISEKFAKIKEKEERAKENMRIAQLDEDDEKNEEKKSEEQRELDNEIIERNQLAAKNVDEIVALQSALKTQGKSQREIKQAVNELKGEQKLRNRPIADALKNPVKNPETGLFEEE